MTKKLKVIGHIESRIIRNVVGRDRLGRIEVTKGPTDQPPPFIDMHRKVLIDYRVTCGFQAAVDDCGPALQNAQQKAVRALTRELYGELREELFDILEWSMSEGIGRDLEDRIGRLIDLTEGKEVRGVT